MLLARMDVDVVRLYRLVRFAIREAERRLDKVLLAKNALDEQLPAYVQSASRRLASR
jgi:hypothetical protein